MLPKKHPVGRQFGGFITRFNTQMKGEFRIDFVRNTDPVTFEAGWNGALSAGYKRLKGHGIEAIRFSADDEAGCEKLVFDAAWAAVRAKAPKEGARLQSMLLK